MKPAVILTTWMANTPELNTLSKVAAKSGLGFGTVQRFVNGRCNPHLSTLGKIASAFGRSAADFFEEDSMKAKTGIPMVKENQGLTPVAWRTKESKDQHLREWFYAENPKYVERHKEWKWEPLYGAAPTLHMWVPNVEGDPASLCGIPTTDFHSCALCEGILKELVKRGQVK